MTSALISLGLSAQQAPEHDETEQHLVDAQAANDEAIFNSMSNELSNASKAISHFIGAVDIIDAIKPTSADARKLARGNVYQCLEMFGVDPTTAAEKTAGIEAEDADVGNEAASSFKEWIKSIIEWVVNKAKEWLRYVAKAAKKLFGENERLLKRWKKRSSESKKKQSNYKLEKNAKHDFTHSSDSYYVEDSLKSGTELADCLKAYVPFIEATNTTLSKVEVKELEKADVCDDNGDIKDDAKANSVLSTYLDAYNRLTETKKETLFGPNVTSKYQGKGGTVSKDTLLGRVAFRAGHNSDAENESKKLSSFVIGFGELSEKQKVKEKANMALVDAETCEKICDANIEVIESLVTLTNDRAMNKAKDKLTKATKTLKKWEKEDIDDDDDDKVQKRIKLREAVNVATKTFDVARTMLVNFPLELAKHVKTLSEAQHTFVAKSLAEHKKD